MHTSSGFYVYVSQALFRDQGEEGKGSILSLDFSKEAQGHKLVMSRGFGGARQDTRQVGVTSLTVTLPRPGSTGEIKQMGWSRAYFIKENRPWLCAGHWR